MLATIFENVKNDRQFSASTGLHKVEFYELLYVYEEVEAQERDWQKNTKGTDLSLSTSELRLFFVLYYLKAYPSYDVLGLCFNIDGSTCERNIKQIYPILQQALAREKMLPIRELSQVELLQEALEGKKKYWLTLLNELSNVLQMRRNKRNTIVERKNNIQ